MIIYPAFDCCAFIVAAFCTIGWAFDSLQGFSKPDQREEINRALWDYEIRIQPTIMYEGKIIEYIDQGSLICSLCLQDRGNRLHLLTHTNREVNLAPKRALLVSQGHLDTNLSRQELLSKLRETDDKRKKLKDQVEIPELWELMREEDEYFDGKYLAELYFGEPLTDDHVSALVRSLFEDKLYFKMKDTQFLSNSQEKIEQILKQRDKEEAREELLNEGGKWLSAILEAKESPEPSCKEEVIRMLVELSVYGKDSAHYKDGKEILSRAGIDDIGEARNILIRLGFWDEDENLDLIRYDIRKEFPLEILHDCRQLISRGVEKREREDLRYCNIFTIDGPLTRDFDDALNVEIRKDGIHVGIHIADVADAVSLDSPIDREALQRGASLYLPCIQVPMLPPELSQDTLSLKQDCDRGALSLLCRFDRQGDLLDFRFTPSLIRVRQRLDYEGVDDAYREDEGLNTLYRIGRLLHQRRIDSGAMILSLPEISIQIDPDSRINLALVDQATPGRMMVAEFMILYNWLAAKFCRDHEIPILYRSQDPPSEKLPLDESNYVHFVFKQRRKLGRLAVDTNPKPHAGLGLDAYTTVSSPIRRYADLVVQRQIRNFLMGKAPLYDLEDLEKIRIHLGTVLKDLGIVRRNRDRYWIQKYFLQHMGETFQATVLDVMKSRFRLLLPDFQFVVEIKRATGQDYQEGQHLRLKITKADPWNDVVRVDIVGP